MFVGVELAVRPENSIRQGPKFGMAEPPVCVLNSPFEPNGASSSLSPFFCSSAFFSLLIVCDLFITTSHLGFRSIHPANYYVQIRADISRSLVLGAQVPQGLEQTILYRNTAKILSIQELEDEVPKKNKNKVVVQEDDKISIEEVPFTELSLENHLRNKEEDEVMVEDDDVKEDDEAKGE
ncbi:hypothetical protein ACLB2K_035635 [Fragaria x ananassa]